MSLAPTLVSLANDLGSGCISARDLVESCLSQIRDERGDGKRAFIHVDENAALETADAIDTMRKAGTAPSRFAGIPVSIKDLFDIQGQVTRAGSIVLNDAAGCGRTIHLQGRLAEGVVGWHAATGEHRARFRAESETGPAGRSFQRPRRCYRIAAAAGFQDAGAVAADHASPTASTKQSFWQTESCCLARRPG